MMTLRQVLAGQISFGGLHGILIHSMPRCPSFQEAATYRLGRRINILVLRSVTFQARILYGIWLLCRASTRL